MTRGVEITPLRADDLADMAALRVHWNGRTFSEQLEYVRWKYLANPYLPEPLVALARVDSRVVGMRGFYGTCWQVGAGGGLHTLPAASESFILPEHRHGGEIFQALNDAGLELAVRGGFSHLVNLSSSPEHALAATMHFGWKAVVRKDTLSRGVQHGPRLSAHVPGRLTVRVRQARSRLRRPSSRAARFASLDNASWHGAHADVVLGRTCPSWVPDLLARCRPPDRLGPAADPAFVSWRFANPWFAYRFLSVGGPDDGAYLALCGDAGVPSAAVVVDWQGTSADAREVLIGAVTAHGPQRLEILSTCLGADDRSILLRHGFTTDGPPDVPVRRRPALLVRPTSGSGVDRWALEGLRLDTPEAWEIRALSSDAC
jgi:hypothetical protein